MCHTVSYLLYIRDHRPVKSESRHDAAAMEMWPCHVLSWNSMNIKNQQREQVSLRTQSDARIQWKASPRFIGTERLKTGILAPDTTRSHSTRFLTQSYLFPDPNKMRKLKESNFKWPIDDLFKANNKLVQCSRAKDPASLKAESRAILLGQRPRLEQIQSLWTTMKTVLWNMKCNLSLWGRCLIWCVKSRGTNKMQLGSPLCTALALEPNSFTDGGLLLRDCPRRDVPVGCGTSDKSTAGCCTFLVVDLQRLQRRAAHPKATQMICLTLPKG